MSYVQKVLLPGERVLYETRLHWLIFLRPVVLLIIAAAVAITSLYAPTAYSGAVLIAAGVIALLGLLDLLAALIRRASTDLAVTDQRVVFKRGILSRHTIEMNRGKVESVDVDQSLLGRLLGYGTVRLRGTGGSLEPMVGISDPLTLRSYITTEPMRQTGPGAG